MRKSYEPVITIINKAILRVFICIMGLLLCWSSESFAESAKDIKNPTGAPSTPQVTAPGKPSSKTENFLNEIGKTRSLEELSRMFKSSNFTQAELKELEQQVKKPAYSNKLQQLLDQEMSSIKARMEAKNRPIIAQKEREFHERQKQELIQLNNQGVAKLQSLRAKGTMTKRAPSIRSTAVAPGPMQSQATRGEVSAAKINSVSPAAATVGSNLTISGEEFGASAGRVVILIGRELIECSVSSWEQRRIVVIVPADLQDIVGETEKEGIVWVKLRGGETGPTFNLTVRPDTTSMAPEITSLSSAEIRPGQTLVIEGRNFLTERRGTVIFRFGGRTYSGDVDDWRDTFISVTLPEDISGLNRTDGTVTITNHTGLQAAKSFTFVPTLSTFTLLRERSAGAFIFGYKGEKTDHDFDLVNGWKVADNYLESNGGWFTYGCEFVTRAVPGSTHAYSRTLMWVDFIGAVWCGNFLRIEGPKGLRYS